MSVNAVQKDAFSTQQANTARHAEYIFSGCTFWESPSFTCWARLLSPRQLGAGMWVELQIFVNLCSYIVVNCLPPGKKRNQTDSLSAGALPVRRASGWDSLKKWQAESETETGTNEGRAVWSLIGVKKRLRFWKALVLPESDDKRVWLTAINSLFFLIPPHRHLQLVNRHIIPNEPNIVKYPERTLKKKSEKQA